MNSDGCKAYITSRPEHAGTKEVQIIQNMKIFFAFALIFASTTAQDYDVSICL